MITAKTCIVTLDIKPRSRRSVFSGFISRAIIARALSKVYGELFEDVHDRGNPTRVYVSPLEDEESGRFVETVRDEGVYNVIVSSLSLDLKPIVMEILEKGKYELKDYKIHAIDATLMEAKVRPKEISPGSKILLEFTSPASFRITPIRGYLKRAAYFPFPRPDLLIKSIIRTIRENYPDLKDEILSWNPEHVRLVDFKNVRTKTYRDFRGRPYIAFTGKFVYEVSEERPYDLLFSVAEFTGVGAWRFSGFGRVRTRVLGDDQL